MKDGHEICFVGDEGFRELSQVDPQADNLLNKVSKHFACFSRFTTIVFLNLTLLYFKGFTFCS